MNQEIFNTKYVKQENGCWIWKEKNQKSISRTSWDLHNTVSLRDNQTVCHKCENIDCVNPNHLYLEDQT